MSHTIETWLSLVRSIGTRLIEISDPIRVVVRRWLVGRLVCVFWTVNYVIFYFSYLITSYQCQTVRSISSASFSVVQFSAVNPYDLSRNLMIFGNFKRWIRDLIAEKSHNLPEISNINSEVMSSMKVYISCWHTGTTDWVFGTLRRFDDYRYSNKTFYFVLKRWFYILKWYFILNSSLKIPFIWYPSVLLISSDIRLIIF